MFAADVFSKAIQLHTHIYSLFFKPISCLGYYRVLSRAGVLSRVGPRWFSILNVACVRSPSLPVCPPLPTLPPGD